MTGRLTIKVIDGDSYFEKADEFRVWLRLTKEKSLDSLTSADARDIFTKEFMPLYNDNKLLDMYYLGLPQEIRQHSIKSTHQWGFKISTADEVALDQLTEDVDKQTRSHNNIW